MQKMPWFPFFVNDFLASSKLAMMTTEEIGAYTLLMCHAWSDPSCSVPDDDDAIRKLGRISGDISRLRACFSVKRGRLVNERLSREWKKTKEIRVLRTIAGRKGGQAHAQALALAKHGLPSSIPQSQSQSQSQKRKREREHAQELTKTPIPEDFSPSENHELLARARGLELNVELLHFVGKAQEQGWLSGNWALKFRNWLLQETKFRQARRIL